MISLSEGSSMQSAPVGYSNYSHLTTQTYKSINENFVWENRTGTFFAQYFVHIFSEHFLQNTSQGIFSLLKYDWFPKIEELRNSDFITEFKKSVFRLQGPLKDRQPEV